jgi:two-component system LytT family sensor kinase
METTSPVDVDGRRTARPSWLRAVWLLGFWTLIGLIFATVSYAATFAEASRRIGFVDALRLNLAQFYLWAPFSLLIFWFSRRFPVEFQARRIRNLLLHVPALLLCAAAHQTIQVATLWCVMPRMRLQFPTLADYYRAYFGFGFYIDLLIGSLIIIAVHALLYYQRFRAGELEQASLKTQLAQAHLKALKMQLHPHFLFNTLHSISSLTLEDPPKANSMIARLGDFLRLTLEQSDDQLVSLKNEMEFVRCYLDIEQARFGDRLTVNFAIEPATLTAQVPHLILQPVVENAIQHAIAPRAAPGRIEIEAKRQGRLLHIAVRDSGPGLTAENGSLKGHRVGLANVRARLSQIYDGDFTFEMTNSPEGGLTVTLQLPFQTDASDKPEHSR